VEATAKQALLVASGAAGAIGWSEAMAEKRRYYFEIRL
jgi:hypothetical protein